MLKGEGTFFVTSMMGMLGDAQEVLIAVLEEKIHKLKNLEEAIAMLEQKSPAGFRLYHHQILYLLGQVTLFGPRSGVSLEECGAFLAKSRGTVRPVMQKLVEEKLVIELSKKPLVFALTDSGKELLGLKDF